MTAPAHDPSATFTDEYGVNLRTLCRTCNSSRGTGHLAGVDQNGSSRIKRGPMAADRFTTLSNALLRDPRLSFKAKGLLGLISTYRDGYGLTAAILSRHTKDSAGVVESALRELEEHGYLEREQRRNADGTLGGTAYLIPPGLIGERDLPDGEEHGLRELEEPSREGWAYAMAAESGGAVKIGCAANVRTRLRSAQTNHPERLSIIWQAAGGRALEDHLHNTFHARRLRGEWFDFSGKDAARLIEDAAALWAGGAQ